VFWFTQKATIVLKVVTVALMLLIIKQLFSEVLQSQTKEIASCVALKKLEN